METLASLGLPLSGLKLLSSPSSLIHSFIFSLAKISGKVSQPQFETAQPCSRAEERGQALPPEERDNPLPSGDHARREELSAAVVELVGLCSFALRLNEGASDDGVLKNEKE